MNSRSFAPFMIALLCWPACDAAEPVVFHVSPNGNDRGPGTKASPFATLERARDAVRTDLRKAGAAGPIAVELAPAVYHLDRTLVLGPEDSGTPQRPVTYRSAGKGPVVISAGAPVRNWKLVDRRIPAAPAASVGSLWEAPLPPGIQITRTLSDSAGLLERAGLGPIVAQAVGSGDRHLRVEPSDLRAWEYPTSIEVALAPKAPYLWNVLSVASIDPFNGVITTTAPGTFDLAGNAFLENVPEGLDGPGKWWLDSKARRIILWPRKPGQPDGVFAARMAEAIRLHGTAASPVRYITFQDLTFSHGERGVKTEKTVQMIPLHDWEYYDHDNAVLRLRDTANIRVEDCVFTASGGAGVRMDFGSRNNSVSHNLFSELGESGISLVGSLPGGGDVHSHHELGFNYIHHIGRALKAAPGIFVFQSHHTRIHDNRLHDLPYAAIVLFGSRDVFMKPQTRPVSELLYGGDNIIEHNEVSRAIQKLGDGSGIYISATPPGNVVRRNHIHDVERQMNGGIRLDDQQGNVLVEENLIHNLTGMGIILKHVNHCRHNIVVDCTAMISVRHWGPNAGSTIHRNILVSRKAPSANTTSAGPYAPFFTEYKPVKLDDYDLAGNVLFSPADPSLAERALSAISGIGKQAGIVADPMFVNSEKNDFRLKADSPALLLGFPRIAEWGPRGKVGPRL